MSEYIYKIHNKSLILYHLVCSIKYRLSVLREEVSITFQDICSGISERYEIHFVEKGFDENHYDKCFKKGFYFFYIHQMNFTLLSESLTITVMKIVKPSLFILIK